MAHLTMLNNEFSVRFESIRVNGEHSHIVTFQLLDGGSVITSIDVEVRVPAASLENRVAQAESDLMKKFANMATEYHQAKRIGYR